MTISFISNSIVNSIKGTEFEGMSIKMMATMVMLEVAASKKNEAEKIIREMKGQNDRAKKLNNLVDRLNSELGTYTKDDENDKSGRATVLSKFEQEAKDLGVDVSDWNGAKSSEQARAIISTIQHMAENCNSDNLTQMVKL